MPENINASDTPFRVLSLDGGGMRGLYTATLLKILAEHFSSISTGGNADPDYLKFGKYFNLIAGTSTGGILAVALAAGISLEEIISLYKEKGLEIFPEKNCIPSGGFEIFKWCCRFFRKPTANSFALCEHLEKIFKRKTLFDIYQEMRVALCIPCVDATTRKTVVIKTPHSPNLTRDGKRSAVDVCMATTAAPIFFPMAAIPSQDVEGHETFIDGGLWANNPIVVAMIEALELAKENQPIEIISVGTCNPPSGQTFEKKDCIRGVYGWKFGSDALSLSLDAQSFGHDAMAKKLQNYLKKPCKIVRLPSSSPSPADAKHFGLDKAYEKALAVLVNSAKNDAQMIQSQYRAGDTDIKIFASIFEKEAGVCDV